MSLWKRMATERLQQYTAMKKAERFLQEQLRQCRQPGRIAPEQRLDVMARRTALEERYAYVKRWVEATEKALAVLPPEEYLVVERLYFTPDKGRLVGLCDQLHCEQSTVYRRRDKALERITRALGGKGRRRRETTGMKS